MSTIVKISVHNSIYCLLWVSDDKIETNIKINYDANNDLPALFGIYTNDAISQAYKNVNSYAGTVWQLSDSSITIITIDFWN